MAEQKQIVSVEQVEQMIFLLRGQKVMVDADLAVLYGVQTKVLNQAVTRHKRRFPSDFMFRLTKEESHELVTNCDRLKRLKHSSVSPRAFTEQGVAMLSTVLNSDQAIHVNIEIMRAFVRSRQMLAAHKDLARKLKALEKKHDDQFKIVFEAIAELMTPLSVLAAEIRRRTQTVLSKRCDWTKSTLRLSEYATG